MNYDDYDVSISGPTAGVMMKGTFRHGLAKEFGRFVAITPTEGGLLFSKADGPRTGYALSHAKNNPEIEYVQMPRCTRLGVELVQLAGHYRTLHEIPYVRALRINTDEKESGAC